MPRTQESYDTDFHCYEPGTWDRELGVTDEEYDGPLITCWRCIMDIALYGRCHWDKTTGEHVCPLDVEQDKQGNFWHYPPPEIPTTQFKVVWDARGNRQWVPSDWQDDVLQLQMAV